MGSFQRAAVTPREAAKCSKVLAKSHTPEPCLEEPFAEHRQNGEVACNICGLVGSTVMLWQLWKVEKPEAVTDMNGTVSGPLLRGFCE